MESKYHSNRIYTITHFLKNKKNKFHIIPLSFLNHMSISFPQIAGKELYPNVIHIYAIKSFINHSFMLLYDKYTL